MSSAMQHYASSPRVFDSDNYMWSSKDQLGSGAGGTVYVGYHKGDGKKVAVKEFRQANYFTIHEQEIEVLKSIPPHKNIVRLFAAEKEKVRHVPALVMELCTAGSLYDVIEAPENAFGLCEEEFRTVMIDITEGLAHLRRHNIIHRDIKPGNIMRCISPDGSYSFKLTDFGAARELTDGDRFVSLYGTEEYLHPDVYEKALVNTYKNVAFPAKVDLWSIGATLYHAATGRLPFQSFGQRKDRAAMFQIISTKRRAVISGVQRQAGGVVDWSEHLPGDTRISRGLKLLLEPILQGVLETKFEFMMDFDDYFRQVKVISQRRVFDVFVVSKCECLKVYLEPNSPNPFSALKQLVRAQTAVEEDYMELYFENLPLSPGPRDMIPLDRLPQTSENKPIFVYGGQVQDHLSSVTMRPVPNLPATKEIKESSNFLKECQKLIHYHYHVTGELNRKFNMMHQAALCMSYVMKKDSQLLEKASASVKGAFDALQTKLYGQIGSLWTARELLNGMNACVDGALEHLIAPVNLEKQQLQESLQKFQTRFEPVHVKALSVLESAPLEEWDVTYQGRAFHRSHETVKHYCKEVEEDAKTAKQLVRNVLSPNHPTQPHDAKVLTFTKGQLHKRMLESQERLSYLMSSLTALHKKLHNWLNAAVVTRDEIKALQIHIERELERFHMESARIEQSSIPMADQRVKDTAKQIADIFDECVSRTRRTHQSAGGSPRVTPRTPNSPFSDPQSSEEVMAIMNQADRLLQSLSINKQSVKDSRSQFESMMSQFQANAREGATD